MTYPHPAQPPPPAKPQWTHRKTLAIGAAALGALAAFGLGAVAGESAGRASRPANLTGNPAPTVTVTMFGPAIVGPTTTVTAKPAGPTATPRPTPKPKPTIDDGKVVVGDDIPAGTYDVRGAPSDCYYAITKHGTSTIIDNSFGTGGHLTVTLKVGQDFETEGCGVWTKK